MLCVTEQKLTGLNCSADRFPETRWIDETSTQTHTNTNWVCLCCLSHSQRSLTRTVINTLQAGVSFRQETIQKICFPMTTISPITNVSVRLVLVLTALSLVSTQCICEHSNWTSCEWVLLLTAPHVSLQVDVENKRVHSQLPLIMLAQHTGHALPLLLIWHLQLTKYSEHRRSAALFSDPYYKSTAVTFMTLCSHFFYSNLHICTTSFTGLTVTRAGSVEERYDVLIWGRVVE